MNEQNKTGSATGSANMNEQNYRGIPGNGTTCPPHEWVLQRISGKNRDKASETVCGNIPFVVNNYPEVLDLYRDTITQLQNVSYTANNTLLEIAERMQLNPHLVFEEIKNHLDRIASNTEQLLLALDPNYELSSDTDDEKIAEAVKEHALRHPSTR